MNMPSGIVAPMTPTDQSLANIGNQTQFVEVNPDLFIEQVDSMNLFDAKNRLDNLASAARDARNFADNFDGAADRIREQLTRTARYGMVEAEPARDYAQPARA